MGNGIKLIFAIAICEAAGLIGAFFTTPQIDGWYTTLIKPALTPPDWVFGPVWITLYALMGIALFLIWNRYTVILQNYSIRKWQYWLAVIIFFVQLALNAFWSIAFFGLEDVSLALFVVFLLWFAIIATVATFARISKYAAWLLAPYLLWVTFAMYLNFSILLLN